MMNVYKGLRGMCWKILRSYGIEPDEIEELVRLALIDVRDTRVHFYWPRYAKPLRFTSSRVTFSALFVLLMLFRLLVRYIVYGRKP